MPVPMSEVMAFSIAIFAIVIIFLLASAMVGPGVIVAIRNLTRRWRQTLLAVAALAVGTAMITSSLVVGDSLRSRVEQNIDANLNDVGVVVHAPALVPLALVEGLSASGGPLDGVPSAGIIMTACSVRSAATGEVVAGAGLNALDPGSGAIGSFKGDDGRPFAPSVQRDMAIINERLAKDLFIAKGDRIVVAFDDPSTSYEDMFSERGTKTMNLTVQEIVRDEGLGRLQLSVKPAGPLVTVSLSTLWGMMAHPSGKAGTGMGNGVNTVLIKHRPDDGFVQRLAKALDDAVGFREAGLYVSHDVAGGDLAVTSYDIFFKPEDLPVPDGASAGPMLTYFVDAIRSDNGVLSYSTVTGIDPALEQAFGDFHIKDGSPNGSHGMPSLAGGSDIVLTNWTADVLRVGKGGMVHIDYSVLDEHYKLVKSVRDFTVTDIVYLDGRSADEGLMPPYPGIEGVDSCLDWHPPFDIDLSTIKDVDKEYWNTFHGTPKAYIRLDTASSLWGIREGNITMMRFAVQDGVADPPYLDTLNDSLGMSDAGLFIQDIRGDLMSSISALDIFTEMFIAFGSITIISGMVFVANTYLMAADERRRDMGIIRAIGTRRRRMVQTMAFEGSVAALGGAVVGVICGLGLALGLVEGFNTIWTNMTQGNRITLHVAPETLLLSAAAGLLLSVFTVLAVAMYEAGREVEACLRERGAGKGSVDEKGARIRMLCASAMAMVTMPALAYAAIVGTQPSLMALFVPLVGIELIVMAVLLRRRYWLAGLVAIGVTLLSTIPYFRDPDALLLGVYVVAGLVIVAGLLAVVVPFIGHIMRAVNLDTLGSGKTFRTGATVAIFAIVVFSVTAISVNIEVQRSAVGELVGDQGAGYHIVAEAASPIEMDMRDSAVREKVGLALPNGTAVTMMKSVGTAGSTCSNMDPNYPPRILGVDSDFISSNKFQFEVLGEGKDAKATWEALGDYTSGDDVVPMIGDYNTIVWIYAGALGSTFDVDTETGGTVHFKVVGVLKNGILGGNFMISKEALEHLFPDSAGYMYMLIGLPGEPSREDVDATVRALETSLFTYGVDATPVIDLVSAQLFAEQDYMRLFQAYLAMGLVVGVGGLGVVTARTVTERRREISVLRALGVPRGRVGAMVVGEAVTVALIGALMGTAAGVMLAFISFPAWGTGAAFVLPATSIILVMALSLLVALGAAAYPARKAMGLAPADGLKRE